MGRENNLFVSCGLLSLEAQLYKRKSGPQRRFLENLGPGSNARNIVLQFYQAFFKGSEHYFDNFSYMFQRFYVFLNNCGYF